jgi:bifunctional N-acetylglucosamine-1-phosphate-uridyltransferase/glucosamine-1-phosphate-acetyltransferase GlmU-like protein
MSYAQRLRLADLDIAVLAGGLGTRLQYVLHGQPKVLAPIGDHPFLYHLLNWLRKQRAAKVILCLGHQAQPVLEYLSRMDFRPLEIAHVIEPEPRGTAGAVAFAREHLKSDPVIVIWCIAPLRRFSAQEPPTVRVTAVSNWTVSTSAGSLKKIQTIRLRVGSAQEYICSAGKC